MKKFLLLASVVVLTCTTQVFAQEETLSTETKGPCPVTQFERKAPDFGCPNKMRRPHHKKFDIKKFEEELKLTEKQKTQLKELRAKQMAAAKPLFEELKAKEQEAWAIRKQLHEQRIQNKKDFEAILTDKQLKKLKEMKAERKQEFAKRHPQGDMHRRPPMPPSCRCNCGSNQQPLQPQNLSE